MTVGSLPGKPGQREAGWPRQVGKDAGWTTQPWSARLLAGEEFTAHVCPSHPSWLRPPDVGFTPPSSPPTRPRNDRNVFSRLTSNQSQGSALDK